VGYVNQNDRYLLFECFLHHRLSWIESGAPNSLRCLVACWYVCGMTCRKHSMTSSGVRSLSWNLKYSCLWLMPVVTLDSGSGTEYAVETLESCDHQWLADLCTDCSSILIFFIFIGTQWGISNGAPTCFPIRPFALSLKYFHGPLNWAGNLTVRKGHTSACCRLVIEKRTIYNKTLLPRVLVLCDVRGEKSQSCAA